MICPVCKKSVPKFKTNSHVIPAWMMREIKEKGQFTKISEKEIREKHHRDHKADMVCSDCEDRFTKDDTFCAKFFRGEAHFIETVRSKIGNENLAMERYSKDVVKPLTSFLLSLIIRAHLYKKLYTLGDLLGNRYESICSSYLDNENQILQFPFICFKNVDDQSLLARAHSLPQRVKFDERNCVLCVLFGYSFHLYTDHRGMSSESQFVHILNHDELLIAHVDWRKTKIYSSLFNQITNFERLKKFKSESSRPKRVTDRPD